MSPNTSTAEPTPETYDFAACVSLGAGDGGNVSVALICVLLEQVRSNAVTFFDAHTNYLLLPFWIE